MTLEKILSELRYTSDIAHAVLEKIHRERTRIKEIAETAYYGENFDFLLCRRMPLTRLAVITYLLTQSYDAYKARGIPDSIIFDTFRDVSLRAHLFYEKNGKVGISKADVVWFRHIKNVEIFQIGALQFQPFEMVYLDEETIGEVYMKFAQKQKEAMPNGTPVLNCHIPRGADLRPQAVAASFQKAKCFFKTYFPEVPYQGFLCYSWLLYPPMQRLLPENANIKQFAAHFTILGSCRDTQQAKENLFGQGAKNRGTANATFLQRTAADHWDEFGFACGVISMETEI